jgi:HEAT repeat protein/beta-lactamase regulating signal transducer with metallopeptidase domain
MRNLGWIDGDVVTGVLGWLLTYAVHSTILLAGAVLLTARLIRSDAWRETVWRAALVGAVVTATLQSGLGVRPLASEWRIPFGEDAQRGSVNGVGPTFRSGAHRAAGQTEVTSREPTRATVSNGSTPRAGRIERAASARDVVSPRAAAQAGHANEASVENGLPRDAAVVGASEAREIEVPAHRAGVTSGGGAAPPTWPELLLAMWVAGVSLLVARLTYGQLRLHWLLRDRRPVTEGNVLALLAALRRNAGVWRPIELTTSLVCPGPIALGTSEICVPERFLRDLDPDQQRSALAHELAHLARRDPLWRLLTGLVEAVFFFQPLNRLARLRLREASENLSDDWAVRQTGSALALARCLVEVASWIGRGPSPVSSGTMAMAEGGSPLLLRVERLLSEHIPHAPGGRSLRSAAAVGSVLLVWAAAPVVSAGTIPEREDVSESHAIQEPAAANRPSTPSTDASSAVQSEVSSQEQVVRHAAPGEPLESRWQWATAEAGRRGDSRYWVAYAFERMLPAGRIHVDDSAGWSSDDVHGVPLGARVYGPSFTGPPEAASASGPTDGPPRETNGMVRQPVLVLFQMLRTQADAPRVERVSVRTASAGMSLHGAPLYWLGSGSTAESFDWLRGQVDEMQDVRLQGTVVEAISMHDEADRVVPFLEQVIGSNRPDEVREEAAEGAAWHPTDGSVALLRATALKDRSTRIREEAAETLGDIRTPAAAAAVDELLRVAQPESVREEAVEATAAQQDSKALETLAAVAMEDSSPNIQEEAIEAIAAFPASSGVPLLERIARTHPNTDMRAEAVETLGELDPAAAADVLEQFLKESDAPTQLREEALEAVTAQRSPEALKTIVQVAMSDPDPELQQEAVEALGEFNPADALPHLEQIIWKHPHADVRDEAVETLSEMPADQALPLLDKIVAGHEDAQIVQEAIETIGEFPSDVSEPRLLRILREHPLEEARREALEQLMDQKASP